MLSVYWSSGAAPRAHLRVCFLLPKCVISLTGVVIVRFLPTPRPLLFKLQANVDGLDLGALRYNDSVTNFTVTFSLLCLCRRFFQTAHFYVEDSSSPRVVANENIPVIPIPGKTSLHLLIRVLLKRILRVKECGVFAAVFVSL